MHTESAASNPLTTRPLLGALSPCQNARAPPPPSTLTNERKKPASTAGPCETAGQIRRKRHCAVSSAAADIHALGR